MFAQRAELLNLAHRRFKVGEVNQPLEILSGVGVAGQQARLYPAQVGDRAGHGVVWCRVRVIFWHRALGFAVKQWIAAC